MISLTLPQIGLLLDIVGVIILWFSVDYVNDAQISSSSQKFEVAVWGGVLRVDSHGIAKSLRRRQVNIFGLCALIAGFMGQFLGGIWPELKFRCDIAILGLTILFLIAVLLWRTLLRRICLNRTFRIVNDMKHGTTAGDSARTRKIGFLATAAETIGVRPAPDERTPAKLKKYVLEAYRIKLTDISND